MKCTSCKKEATVSLSYVERKYCDSCFLRYLEQRFRKDLRMNKPIKPRDTVKLYDDGSKEFFLADHFLKEVFGENLFIEHVKEKGGDVFIPTNMDRHITMRLNNFLENKPIEENDHFILDNILEEEIVIACRILGREEKETEEVNPLIEKMESKYPDTKFSLYNAFDKLEKELKSN